MMLKLMTPAMLCLSVCSGCIWRKSAWGDHDIAERKIRSETIRNEEVRKKGTRVEWTFKKYDKRGHLLEIKELDKDSVVSRWERRDYNRQGKEVFSETLDSLGNVIKKEITLYHQGKESERIIYGAGRQPEKKIKSVYNNYGDLASEITTDETGAITRQVTYTYDKKGMLISRITTDGQGKIVQSKTFQYAY